MKESTKENLKTSAALGATVPFTLLGVDSVVNHSELVANRASNLQDGLTSGAAGFKPEYLGELHQEQFDNIFNSVTGIKNASDSISSSASSIFDSVRDMASSVGGYATDLFSSVKESALSMWSNGADGLINNVIDVASTNTDATVMISAASVAVAIKLSSMLSRDSSKAYGGSSLGSPADTDMNKDASSVSEMPMGMPAKPSPSMGR